MIKSIDYTRAVNWIVQNSLKCNHIEKTALINAAKSSSHYYYVNLLIRLGWIIEFDEKYEPILGEKKESYFTEDELLSGYIFPDYQQVKNERFYEE